MKDSPFFKITALVLFFTSLMALVIFTPKAVSSSRANSAPTVAQARKILYAVPTPTPIEILWVDTAGNIGMRGIEAVVPGVPKADAKLSDSCRAAATRNGEGTLTICPTPDVGKTIAATLGGFL